MSRLPARWPVLAFVVLFSITSVIAACGDGSSVDEVVATVAPAAGEGISMGDGALGGNASTTPLAQLLLNDLPSGDLVWVSHGVRLEAGDDLEHDHEFAFVYAVEGTHFLLAGSERQELRQGAGAALSPGSVHGHEAGSGPSVFWEIRLAPPGSAPPASVPQLRGLLARLVFESDVLEEIPREPLAVFVHVLVPPGGQTSVHTHPGPEFIYQSAGEIAYQNSIIGVIEMGPGAIEGIPPGTAVQKRNPFQEDAEFLSWFLVDAAEPFASPARFAAPAARGENLAFVEAGARVVGVSSVFGGGANDGTWGGDNVIDGDPTTQWSTDGDGENAWIEIELPTRTHVTSLGFWTRTMGTSAEIFSFRVVTDDGEVFGPFELADSFGVHYFETDLTAKRLRFEAVETSGGNAGAVEIEVYGVPAP